MKIEIVDREGLRALNIRKAHTLKYSTRGWPLQCHCSYFISLVDNGGVVESESAFVQPGCAWATTIQDKLVVSQFKNGAVVDQTPFIVAPHYVAGTIGPHLRYVAGHHAI